jgi:hypothetical protein
MAGNGVGLWSDRSHEASTTIAQRRGIGSVDPEVLRAEGERGRRQLSAEATAEAEASRLQVLRAEMKARVEAEVGSFGFVLTLPGGLVLAMTVPPTLDTEQQARLTDGLSRLIGAVLQHQRAAAIAAAYRQEVFQADERSWRNEVGRIVQALAAEGLLEVVER